MDIDIRQDFGVAMGQHLIFKSKLRSFLYGGSFASAPTRDPDLCSLGIWIAERRRGPWGYVPEWAELDRLHRLLHREANQLMDMALQGFEEQARAGLTDLLPTIDRIPRLLQTIQNQLRTPG
ncbi:CZB domain-containing protein [Hymenobacter metallicola]|uniref:Chemoreceptor zinc-binding domain-containing protein n=1 Tax=Hymenobacter metallicola TaxID=2563114 RepID=A0A4Z0PZ39_9BACT|nr:CZB domain-containing protein [Hymenobacter metallicola]TGE22987.1 hypothetical protein E5K02_21765 [Hymenobacter metallicola]